MYLSKYFYIIIFFLISGCTSNNGQENLEQSHAALNKKAGFITINGNTQGTTYLLKYEGDSTQIYQQEVDAILKEIDDVLSLWVPTSEICKFNNDTTTSFKIIDPKYYFHDVFFSSKEVYKNTNGYFDPSIDTIIEALGLGLKKKENINFEEIKQLRSLCSFKDSDVNIEQKQPIGLSYLIQKKSNTRLNFNALAQGYAVDVICDFLKNKGHQNYYVEIGGELKVNGMNPSNNEWRIGIDRPTEGERQVDYLTKLHNTSLATSGSYRKYIVKDGRKYSHTINPLTGLPVDHNLLSVTVMMESCALADGYATAFMAMGKEKTIEYILNHPSYNIEVFLIFQQDNALLTYASSGFIVEMLEQ